MIVAGARLDAWAARISRGLAKAYPAHAAGFEANRLDELQHAAALSGMIEQPEIEVDDTAIVATGSGATTPHPLLNAIYLNLVERRSERQFRLLARALPAHRSTFRDIAADEKRHIAYGVEVLRYENDPNTLATILRSQERMNAIDIIDRTVPPEMRERLKVLNATCVHGLLLDLHKRA